MQHGSVRKGFSAETDGRPLGSRREMSCGVSARLFGGNMTTEPTCQIGRAVERLHREGANPTCPEGRRHVIPMPLPPPEVLFPFFQGPPYRNPRRRGPGPPGPAGTGMSPGIRVGLI